MHNAIERRGAPRGHRSCQDHGICKGRYPACGRCDDDHPEDEPPMPTPFEQMWFWVCTGFVISAIFAAVGMLAGYAVTRWFTP